MIFSARPASVVHADKTTTVGSNDFFHFFAAKLCPVA